MKILVVLVNRGNYFLKYFIWFSDEFKKLYPEHTLHIINLMDYPDYNQTDYDVLIYNAFPDEQHQRKFNKDLTSRTDEKFRQFTGLKILFDNHDNGSKDGFAHLADSNCPRIKANPDYRIIDKLNVFMTVPFVTYPVYRHPQDIRCCELLCSMRTKDMPPTRKLIMDEIESFNPMTNKLPPREHAHRLCQTLINVVSTGTGDSSRTHTDTLAAGALLLAQTGIENIKLLPHIDLVENEHFVTFDLSNIKEKLKLLLADHDEVDRIRLNGLQAFTTGYDLIKSAKQLNDFLYANT